MPASEEVDDASADLVLSAAAGRRHAVAHAPALLFLSSCGLPRLCALGGWSMRGARAQSGLLWCCADPCSTPSLPPSPSQSLCWSNSACNALPGPGAQGPRGQRHVPCAMCLVALRLQPPCLGPCCPPGTHLRWPPLTAAAHEAKRATLHPHS